ncbi:ABC transporter ATP-binding protein [Microvirga terrestris]|uniref:ABC transporter ATP-binding protein n=1 Tax=Microvirga terrestris TaxID=2791024 RepID=A0ABS0HQ45_9HYPH|nr:ABC transporter ATP-binding protein [Microvirga terrestris]MBF9195347.1 ABC transporter ATP-binding protein [Microvirga terrestris]
MALIKLENITLEFPVQASKSDRRQSSSKESHIGGQLSLGPSGQMVVRALDQLSLTLGPGDRLALLGHNGAGKTTLLRVMAKLYPPTHGRVTVQGRVAPLLNLGFGLDMDSTGYDNIFIRGLYLGMSKADLKKKADAIAEFSELGDFLDLPMRTYSSGMRARLAFAISTHVQTDILLLDEVVATGDARFLKKANEQLENFARDSKLLVLASHSNKVLRDLCNKAVILEHGRIKAFGPIDEIIDAYAVSMGVEAKDK